MYFPNNLVTWLNRNEIISFELSLGSSHYIVWSTSSDKGVLCLVGGKKNINKNLHFDSGWRKKYKKSWKVTFYSKNKQIQLEFMQFWKKYPLIFGDVGGKNKKIMKCQMSS